MSRFRRLLVITEDRPSELSAAGLDGVYMSRYYNPAGCFEEVALWDWGLSHEEWPGLKHRLLRVPPSPEIEVWWGGVAGMQGREPIDEMAFLAGWPGLPQGWTEAAQSFSPDCIRAYGCLWSGWVAIQLGRALGIPVLVSVHNVSNMALPVLREAAALMAVSDFTAAACVEHGADPSRVTTIPNRVDRARFSPNGDVPQGAPSGAPKLLWVARDCVQKNPERLLQACQSLLGDFPDLRLVHAGRSDRDWSAYPFVAHLDSIPNQQLSAWMRWADLFVLPSLWEGFGIVLAEALASGLPCVTSDRLPMREIVQEGVNGLLCDPEAPASIADAVRRLAGDSALRQSLAANARTSSERYDIERIEVREAALYGELVAPRQPLVSLVLPTYNRARLLETAVRNALSLDYPNFELIVVNDGSTDGTRAILDRLEGELEDARLRVIHKENGRLPRALNTGFEAARGEYFTWTSDDNAFRQGALSAMVRELELSQEAVMVFCDYDQVGADGQVTAHIETGPVEKLPEKNVVGACFLYRRSAAEKAGVYDPSLELAEDYDYWIRLARLGSLVHLRRTLYDYGDEPDSLTNRKLLAVREASAQLQRREAGRDPRWREALKGQLVALAGEYKTRGMTGRSLATALRLIGLAPFGRAGWWALARALTPLALLRWKRGTAEETHAG